MHHHRQRKSRRARAENVSIVAELLERRWLLAAPVDLDVKQGPFAKVGSQLTAAFGEFRDFSAAGGTPANFHASDHLLHTNGDKVAVEAYATDNGTNLAAQFKSIGATNILSYSNGAAGRVPFAGTGRLAPT